MATQKRQSNFVLCVRSDGSEDLEFRKVYEALPDSVAAREGYARVIDESGEDYLYPTEYFVRVKLPAAVEREFKASLGGRREVSRTRRQTSKKPLRAARG